MVTLPILLYIKPSGDRETYSRGHTSYSCVKYKLWDVRSNLDRSKLYAIPFQWYPYNIYMATLVNRDSTPREDLIVNITDIGH